MSYQIKRPVSSEYIPLSDKIEEELDNAYFASIEASDSISDVLSKQVQKERAFKPLEDSW